MTRSGALYYPEALIWRNEGRRIKNDMKNYMVRIDLSKLPPENVVLNMSSDDAIKAFIVLCVSLFVSLLVVVVAVVILVVVVANPLL